MVEVSTPPVTISELGTSDHSMVLWEPKCSIYVTVRCMGPKEKETFAMALSVIKWEPLYILETCEEQYAYYQTIIDKLMQMCFPTKVVSRHTSDKPWITDSFRALVRKRQRAHMSGDIDQVWWPRRITVAALIICNAKLRSSEVAKWRFAKLRCVARSCDA